MSLGKVHSKSEVV